ncbi:MAG: DJ-1/PfpI family protein [Deltaproteobacteria bacterium]|nr:DJ-1/PfpI family protein [Deltaproteobacteria bacterium]
MSNRLIPTDPLNIVFPIYPEVTHLDFTGPHQVFARLPNVKPIVASVEGKPVNADGLIFSGLSSLEEIERCDVLCVPGGFGCVAAIEDPTYLSAIRRLALSARYITSVCTGSLILGAAGLLKGRRSACHWAWREFLPLFGAIPDEGRVVSDGNIITGGGVTAGIDFALTLAAELTNLTIAQSIQLGIEYAPAPPFDCGTPDRASKEVLNQVLARNVKIAPNRRAALERAAAELGQMTQTTH